ncbi:MAG: hydroxylamine oxidase, partial [Thermodesulfobacterium geofontis]
MNKKLIKLFGFLILLFFLPLNKAFPQSSLSTETQVCLSCHKIVTPGIVEDWKKSLHSQITLKEALKKDTLSRKVNLGSNSIKNENTVIGCAECHTINPEFHKDTFDHNG